MGEEAKEEEKKQEEEKKEEDNGEKKAEEKKEEKKEEVPEEIVLKVDMHCEACARKVKRSLRGFEGVEDVKTDCKARMVVVKGKRADPVKVCERIQKKSGRKVEIISPLPNATEEDKKDEDTNKKEEEKKDEPAVITVILDVRMHCEACAQVLQKRIREMNGVESVVTDMMNHQVIVKGIIDPTNLVEKVYRKTKKQASIVKDEEKQEDKGEKEGEGKEEDEKMANAKKLEYWPLAYYTDYAYAPQIFSDENPNACTIM